MRVLTALLPICCVMWGPFLSKMVTALSLGEGVILALSLSSL